MDSTIFLFKITYLCLNLIFSVKKFSKILLITAFAILITSSVQSISADKQNDSPHASIAQDLQAGIEYDLIEDPRYKIHLQVVVRDSQNKLISVTEASSGRFLQHELTDGIFDSRLGEKEIVTVDGIKYEKAVYTHTPSINQRLVGLYPVLTEVPMDITIKTTKHQEWLATWQFHYCAEFIKGSGGVQCIPIFSTLTAQISLSEDDIVVNQWTILREMD